MRKSLHIWNHRKGNYLSELRPSQLRVRRVAGFVHDMFRSGGEGGSPSTCYTTPLLETVSLW